VLNRYWPYALLEFPISILRLAATLLKTARPTPELLMADLALIGVRGWALRPYSPKAVGYSIADVKPFDEADDLIWEPPIVFKATDVIDTPDRCGYRLIARVYEAFGHAGERIPFEYDRRTERLQIE
jgi:hypothetical protein